MTRPLQAYYEHHKINVRFGTHVVRPPTVERAVCACACARAGADPPPWSERAVLRLPQARAERVKNPLATPQLLQHPEKGITVLSPPGVHGFYAMQSASFGPRFPMFGMQGERMPVLPSACPPASGCLPACVLPPRTAHSAHAHAHTHTHTT